MKKPKALFICAPQKFRMVYNPRIQEQLETWLDLNPRPFSAQDIRDNPAVLNDVEVILGTWGMLRMEAEFLEQAPKLKAIFYAAGSIRGFCTPELWDRNIRVCSAWRSNAIPVAEYSVAMILLALKRILPAQRYIAENSQWRRPEFVRGNYGAPVGLVSYGAIARLVREYLRPFRLPVYVYDPFLSDENAAREGVQKKSLDTLFAESAVISVHTPWLKETEGLINGALMRSLPEGATLINSARGAVIDQGEMIEVLQERTDLSAVLDVTYPEPPPEGSPLYSLPNVFLTPHIAGSIGDETLRMGDSMADEVKRFCKGESLQHEVTRSMADTMA